MKKAIADKWVKALRSGEFEQGQGALKANNKYCCLGVLQELTGILANKDDEEYLDSLNAYEVCRLKSNSMKTLAHLNDENLWNEDGTKGVLKNTFNDIATYKLVKRD